MAHKAGQKGYKSARYAKGAATGPKKKAKAAHKPRKK